MERSLGMVSHGSEDYVSHSHSPLLRFHSCSCTMEYSARRNFRRSFICCSTRNSILLHNIEGNEHTGLIIGIYLDRDWVLALVFSAEFGEESPLWRIPISRFSCDQVNYDLHVRDRTSEGTVDKMVGG